jgi:hypothetical protein
MDEWLERNDRWMSRLYAAVQIALFVVAATFFTAVVLGLAHTAANIG